MKHDFQRPFSPPAGAREIILVRHGSVDPPTRDGLIAGRSDPPLNAAGRRQARDLGARLAGERVGALVTSPMRRAVETAAVAFERADIETRTVVELVEIFLGEWEGFGIADRGRRGDPEFLRVMDEQRWDLIPGCEPLDAFADRVGRSLDIAADAAPDGTVAVVVTHAAVIAEACRQVTRSTAFAFIQTANGSLTRLVRMPGGRWVLLGFNETSHLDSVGQSHRHA